MVVLFPSVEIVSGMLEWLGYTPQPRCKNIGFLCRRDSHALQWVSIVTETEAGAVRLEGTGGQVGAEAVTDTAATEADLESEGGRGLPAIVTSHAMALPRQRHRLS